MRPTPCGCTSARYRTSEFAADFRENGAHCAGRCGHRPLQTAVQNHNKPSIPKMSRTGICCQPSATACSTSASAKSNRKCISPAPEQGAEKHLRASAINRIQRLFLPTFSGKTEKVGLRSNGCGITAIEEVW